MPTPLAARFRCLLWFAAIAAGPATGAGAESEVIPFEVHRLADGRRYGLIGTAGSQPAPTLFVFQGSLEQARQEPLYTTVARLLARRGFIGVMVDAPAHGEDAQPGEPAELPGWRSRLDRERDLTGGFIAHCRAVLDHLVRERISDPGRVAACGTSRGGFLAFHLAAVEPRIRMIGGIAPVTDLMALREFAGTTQEARARALALLHLAPPLAGRPVWMIIGNQDTRVGTDQAVAFARALVGAGTAKRPDANAVIPVELIVSETAGHRSTARDHELLAAWMLRQFGLSP